MLDKVFETIASALLAYSLDCFLNWFKKRRKQTHSIEQNTMSSGLNWLRPKEETKAETEIVARGFADFKEVLQEATEVQAQARYNQVMCQMFNNQGMCQQRLSALVDSYIGLQVER